MFARLMLASFLADFVFQPSSLVAWKRRYLSGLFLHVGVVVVLSLFVGVGTWSSRYVTLVAATGVLHFTIDWIKILAERQESRGYRALTLFIVDQILHAVTLLMLLIVFGYAPAGTFWEALTLLLNDARYPAVAATYVASVAGGSILVRLLIQPFQLKVAEKPGLERAGAYIGIIERLLLISLVASSQYGAVGFVLAAKSIARYKQIEVDPQFAEYYLIGTLTSSTIAVLAGLLVRVILQ